MAGVASALLPPLWVHFFLRFPYPSEWRKNRRFLQGIYGTFALLALVQVLVRFWALAGDGVLKTVGGAAPDGLLKLVLNLFGFAAIPLYVAASLTGLGFFIAGTFRSPERLRKALLPSLLVTAAMCLDLLAWTILQAKYGHSLLFRRQIFIFMLPAPLIPISFAYAIFRHGLFDVRKVLLRWVSYMAILGLTVAHA